jgi:hypothetical protein
MKSIHILQIHLNIILTSTPRSSEWSFPFRLSIQNFVHISNLPHTAICPAHIIILDLIITVFGEEYKLWSSSLCSFLQPPVTSFLLGPNILLSSLQIYSALNFLVNEILTCYCGSHTFELCHIFKGFISYLNIMISSDDVT